MSFPKKILKKTMKRASLYFLTGAGVARATLAAALLAASFSSSVTIPGPARPLPAQSPVAAATETPKLIQNILPHEFEAQPAEDDEAGELPSYPDEAMAFRRLSMQDEKGEIPLEAPAKARAFFEAARQRTLHSPSPNAGGIGPGDWTYEGPDNVGGRIRAIVIPPDHPDWVIVGAASGGIWLSKDTGATWAPVADTLANIAVNAMVADPVHPGVVYAGTGEGFINPDRGIGNGLYMSNDSGQTWASMPGTTTGSGNINFQLVQRLAMSRDGTTLFAASNSGLQRSINGGPWTKEFTNTRTLDVVVHPNTGNALLASGTGWVKRSSNGGSTWTDSTGFPVNSGRIEVAWSASSPLIAYASVDRNGGEVYKSVDGGDSFALVNTGGNFLANQGNYGNLLWVNPTFANDIIVGGIDLYRSTNGGVGFSKISDWYNYSKYGTSIHADHHIIAAARDYDGVITRTLWFGNDGGLFRVDDINDINLGITHDTDTGFSHINGLGITQFYGVAASDGGGTLRVVGGAQDNGTPLKNGLANWRDIYGGDGGVVAADPTDSNYLYGEYVYLKLFRSDNGGATDASTIDKSIWPGIGVIADSRISVTALFVAPFILDPSNPDTMLAGGKSLWRSTDVRRAFSSPNWAPIKPPLSNSDQAIERISAIAVAPHNSDNIWVGYEGGELFRTSNGTDAQPNWLRIPDPSLPQRYVARIVFDPNSAQVVYVTYGGFSAGNLWKTSDGGVSWGWLGALGANPLPMAPIRGFAVHPNNSAVLYAGTEVGVFASDDGGATWSAPADGPVHVSTDQLIFLGQRLYAATYGRGIWSVTPNIAGLPPPTATPLPTSAPPPPPPASCSVPSPQGKYAFTLVARTGQNGLLEIYDGISINDQSNVSFVGRLASTDAVYVASADYDIRRLTPVDEYRHYWLSAQINNTNQVMVHVYGNQIDELRILNGQPGYETQYRFVPAGSGRYGSSYGSINDSDQAVNPYLDGSTLLSGLVSYPGRASVGASSGGLRPVLSNNGRTIVRLGQESTAPIVLYDPNLSPEASIAGSAFSAKGRRPSVSGDAEVVSFFGNYADPNGIGGGAGGGKPGQGAFISIDRSRIPNLSNGRELQRISGQACNGKLDPGEAFNDVNRNGVLDANEDQGYLFGYDVEKRVAINRILTGDKHRMNIAFVANDAKGPAVFESDVLLPYPESPSGSIEPIVNTVRVIGAGDVVTGVNGKVTSVDIGERLTPNGEIAILVTTDAGAQAIVRAAPQIRRPVVLIPGLMGTGPKKNDTTWFKNRGLPPESLALDPFLGTYDDLLQTLANYGYQKDRDLFVVNYDWRLPPAISDGANDGTISNQTAQAIADTDFRTGLDYLGETLLRAADAWKLYHPDQPDLDAVDVIAHDAGGLIARAYIQSAAYGGAIAPVPLPNGSPGASALPRITI